MSETDFQCPSLETMSSLLPAYDFSEIMASNGSGAVYFANQKSLDRQVALKIFSPALGGDPKFKQSFADSAQSVAGLRHPNLIGFYDSGEVEGMPYIVMEFVPGKSLSRSTSGKAIEFSQSMGIIKSICEGIGYAHENDLVHGNLDTLNILLNQKAEPKIGNFGLSRSVHTGSQVEVPGHFTAPEVLAGEKPSKASDLYSLAAIFYELITGKPYGPGAAPASSLTSSPLAVDKVLSKAGATDPSERLSDASEFYSMLKRAAGNSGPKTAVSLKPAKKSPAKRTPSSASGPNRPAPAVAAASGGSKGGFDTNLFLKIIVIVILLVAVQQLWSYLKVAREGREKENRELVEKRKAAKEKAIAEAKEKMRKKAEDRQNTIANQNDPTKPVIPERFETPTESLERLRSSLKAGRRGEMPVGTITKGESSYFLVTKPLNWADASAFAEEYGGHLALPNRDLSWLPDELTKDRSFWVGAARSGSDAFSLVDGTAWQPPSDISGKELFVLMDGNGGFETANARKLKPFVIQWRMSGSNPATLEAQLTAVGASIKEASPVYPPGTIASGKRHYLHVPLSATWEEANTYADKAGGHLLVLSSGEEITEIEKIASDLKAYDDIWAGAYLKDDLWFWGTGEPWNGVEWLNERNATRPDSAMLIRPGKGWDAKDKTDEASGFMIEWSDDPTTNKGSSSGESGAPSNAAEEFVVKAKEIVIASDKKRSEALAKNMKKMNWDLDAWVRGLKKSSNQLWAPQVDGLKRCIKDSRLYRATIMNEGVSISPYMEKLIKYHVEKQGEIDKEFAVEVAGIRDAYVTKMAEIGKEAEAAGQIKIRKDSVNLIEQAKDLEKWVQSFGVVLEPDEPKVVEQDFEQPFRRRRDFDD
ncbi:MAG: protein kinase [Akkermansiaceae bacterium]